MKPQTIFFAAIVSAAMLTACDQQPATSTPATASAPAAPAATPAVAHAAPAAPINPAIAAWGPRKTVQGKPVNSKNGSDSAIWIKVTGITAGRGAHVSFDGKNVSEVQIRPSGDLVTAAIPLEFLSTPGKKRIMLKPSVDAPVIAVGDFEVTAAQ
jgi:hypothetical protein